eukprot:gb/GEZN01008436.1/.p1 GENE.gb/GEZN01008436.1/~~gb/GEZN01008436.1/.p1  ORF type:complete len:337 (-),score=67.20 gb/GEZN01008436.1/:359-1369(-)
MNKQKQLVVAVGVAASVLAAVSYYWFKDRTKKKPTQVKEWLHDFYLDKNIQMKAKYRKGDIIISVPAKSGTTWMMNIVHQLRSGGDPDVRDIYEQVPWLEFWESPYQTLEDKLRQLDALPTWFPRAFKTHSPYAQGDEPGVPFRPDLKYVVVIRNFEDAQAAFLPFMHKHRAEFLQTIWNVSDEMLQSLFRPATHDDLWKFLGANPRNDSTSFLKAWWPKRHEKNVLLLHFSDMVKDHEGTIRKVANFLEIKLAEEKMQKVLEYTSFKWMKKHGDKFACQHLLVVPLLEPDGMVREGGSGYGKDELPESIKQEIAARCNANLTPDCLKWYHEGGSF